MEIHYFAKKNYSEKNFGKIRKNTIFQKFSEFRKMNGKTLLQKKKVNSEKKAGKTRKNNFSKKF